MLIAARQSMLTGASQLPYDAEVEYLESDGTAYVDTGVGFTMSNDYSLSVRAANMDTGRKVVVGNYGSGYPSISIEFGGTQNAQPQKPRVYAEARAGVAASLFGDTLQLETVYAIEARPYSGSIQMLVNGSVVRSQTLSGSGTNPTTLLVFRDHRPDPAQILHKCRVYSASYTSGGVGVFDLTPVRVGQVGYLYDRVSGQLFGNDGTGSFALGPDKEATA